MIVSVILDKLITGLGFIVSSLKQPHTGHSTPAHYPNLPYQLLNDVCLATV